MTAHTPSPHIEPWLLEILRCPVGLHRVELTTDSGGNPVLMCQDDCPDPQRRRQYPIDSGIPVMLADSAVIVAAPGS
ncbi:MAG: hypothetical protein WBG57_00450 [Ornithinimicrobium sp.]